jgi:hypothetical protein
VTVRVGASNISGFCPSEPAVNRLDKHDHPKRRVIARLRRLGLDVKPVSSASGYDLLVNGELRVALRVAFPGIRRHRVTVNGRRYQYRYRTWHFNFHHHGKLDEQYADFVVCVAVRPGLPSRDETFVLPWEKLTGKTFSLHDGRHPYAGRYASFRDRWDLIAARAKRAGALRQVA